MAPTENIAAESVIPTTKKERIEKFLGFLVESWKPISLQFYV